MKTKWRMLVALIMAVSMLAALTGCTKEQPETPAQEDSSNNAVSEAASDGNKDITLTFMTNVVSTTNDSIKPIVEQYEADGVTIDYQSVAGSTADYQQKLTTLFAAGTYPDILYVPTIWSKMHGSLGIAQELDGQIPQEILDDFNAGPLETCKYEGKLVGLPLSSDCITLFYNKQLLENAGITVPDSYDTSWTWEEFEQAAQTAQQANDTMYGILFGSDFSIELPFFWQSGATVLSSNLDAVAINQQGTIDTLNWFRNLMDKGLCNANIFLGVDDSDAMFVNQRSPFYVANCGSTSNLLKTIEGNFDLGVTYLPHDKVSADKIGGWNMEVTNKTENLTEAMDFLQYMISPEAMNAYCVSTGGMPTRKAAASSIQFGDLDPYAPTFINEIANIPSFVINDCVNSYYQTYKGIMSQEFQNFISKPDQSAETTAQNMEEAIKQAIDFK